MYPKMKHKVDRYVKYVNIVNVVLFTKNTNIIILDSMIKHAGRHEDLTDIVSLPNYVPCFLLLVAAAVDQ